MAPKHRTRAFLVLLVCTTGALVAADAHLATQDSGAAGVFAPLSAFDALGPAPATTVAVARSDDPELPEPVAPTAPLTYAQVEALVRRAVDLAGGFQDLIEPGDRVLIKPCLVSPQATRNTDVRVVKALIRLVHEAAGGDVAVTVGEASAYPAPEDMAYAPQFSRPEWTTLWDAGGYDGLATDPDLAGIDLRLLNLNGPREALVEVEVPHGGYTAYRDGRLWVHEAVLNADVVISVPPLKLHSFAGLTAAMKNLIGLYPGAVYGFTKEVGTAQDEFRHRLVHQDEAPVDWVDEEIVDMALVAGVDFAVIDAINCHHRTYRRNAIIAGRDLVAVDHVGALAAGLNPDDIAHLTLASLAGVGTNESERIDVVGTPIDASWAPFAKGSRYSQDFGQGNRVWLLRGPFAADGMNEPMDHAFIAEEANAAPRSGEAGWSEPVYFLDDRIDLAAYWGVQSGTEVVSYAFSYFDAPQDQEAELWVGSDEALRVYLNGEAVYDFDGTRAYGGDKLVSARTRAPVRAGGNRLLVKVRQRLRTFDFALNLCEPESDASLDGNRVAGLRFHPGPVATTAVEERSARPAAFELGPNYPNPFNRTTAIPFALPAALAGERLQLAVYNMAGQRLRTLVDRPGTAGAHTSAWDGRDDGGREVASGVYVYRLQAGGTMAARRLLLVR